MHTNKPLIKYKHNILGKLKDLNSIIGPLEDNKDCPDNYFLPFSLGHLELVKMVITSRESIKALFPQVSILKIVSELPSQSNLKTLSVDGVEVHYENTLNGWYGYYSVKEEEEDEIIFKLGKITSLLQSTKVEFYLERIELESRLKKIIHI